MPAPGWPWTGAPATAPGATASPPNWAAGRRPPPARPAPTAPMLPDGAAPPVGPAPRVAEMDGPEAAAREFTALRPRLLGIAYRLLGSAWDAEDVVEEAALRWLAADRAAVREPLAYLTTVVSRLA